MPRNDFGDLARPPGPAASSARRGGVLGPSVQTLARWRIEGNGPRYVKLGTRLVAYPEDELHAFVAERRRSTSERPAV